ncbi:MAG: hypothetical protein J7J51_00115 [Candidatus Omnitrophica bacterium]|nr:hypothetical protein [Candidatus Omnitrophota bacterium]
MKRVLFVVETPENIRIITYDYGKMEGKEYVIDLEKEFTPEERIKEIIAELENKKYDTRILKQFLKKRGKKLRRGALRHG